MRIISLTMNAFMTYKSQTTIDFEDMIENGLYLISGPTGAGKTTIFDAMTFALYGVASGSHRNQSYFRSDFADAKDETYVEMVFELHGKIYKVKRSPTYTRPGYKSAKMANAYLSYNNEMIEGVKEVNQKINQLLGVDVHQFKQIVMIAQGEFTKLIYASSEEREKVLRHIFHSESLVVFENLLKEDSVLILNGKIQIKEDNGEESISIIVNTARHALSSALRFYVDINDLEKIEGEFVNINGIAEVIGVDTVHRQCYKQAYYVDYVKALNIFNKYKIKFVSV